MQYAYALGSLIVGGTLVISSLVTAYVYTPDTRSTTDTVITVLIGASLHGGLLFAVAAGTAISFDILAVAGIRFSLAVPLATGYTLLHASMYLSGSRITELQDRPADLERTEQVVSKLLSFSRLDGRDSLLDRLGN
ncbi:MAG: hypothetical protein ACQETI_01010 [Halobacteriota archaeon]